MKIKVTRVEDKGKFLLVYYDHNGKEAKISAWKEDKNGVKNNAIPSLKVGFEGDFKAYKNGDYWNISGLTGSSQSSGNTSGNKYQSNKGYGKTDKDYKTMCLSYAKDLAIAGKIELPTITNVATTFWNWINKENK